RVCAPSARGGPARNACGNVRGSAPRPERLSRLAGPFLVVETLCDLLGITLVVQLEQTVESLGANPIGDREPRPEWRLAMTVIEVEVCPTISIGDGAVELD